MNPTYRFGNQQQEVCLSEVQATVQPLGVASVLNIRALPVPKAPILISVKSVGALGPKLYRSPGGHLYIDFFDAMPEVTGGLKALIDFSKEALDVS